MARKIWGVDSANPVDQELYERVKNQLGLPKYWGRYLTGKTKVSTGLTREEIQFIRNKGVKVLPIYNVMTETIGYEEAQVAARNAIFHARRLGIPKNTMLFANIENDYQVDVNWIKGWVETINPSGYRCGFFHDPVKGEFTKAYSQAVKEDNEVANQSVLWSADPETGASSERKAPRFKPTKPNCKANVWIWKYGRDAKKCPIDTNLADERVLTYLF
ncbi:glycoside hydrolase domain-containing protein [Metabacillus malikii]|uniref:glycoside hydrolase domain-containing protein n=1 Tax=Metabacillus malikii TaxID=1504265 RepID=UPI0027D7A973|nr:glycoside hydrolase domain-containing protein [Metabacillus malikii]